jgi:hypothetical protein
MRHPAHQRDRSYAPRGRSGSSRKDGYSTSGAGWISQVSIQDSPLYGPQTIVQIEKANLLLGGSIGKSALLEWLDAAASGTVGERWSNNNLRLRVAYSLPLPHHLDFAVVGRKRNYIRDSEIIHLPPSPLQAIGEIASP